ncbi:MAG TPA: deoxyguanosinetriphosphate triphosphohydrolase [Mycobacteriales bacterium]
MRFSYARWDLARRVPEPGKISYPAGSSPFVRSEFERDRARVLHSFALRRLAGTTQVEVAGEYDFPRTRLTHSLEVAQIGREMGAALGCDPDLVDAACLAHDLGHPPFGHNGEAALDSVAGRCGGFEGNAQTLRVLTRLEPKALTADGRAAGLNLTRAVLDATVKYPWTRQPGDRAPHPAPQPVGPANPPAKFGVYDDDLPAFEWVRQGAPQGRRCLEAQVMDWADDVAYSVHDVEDGIHTGHVRLVRLADPDEQAELCELTARLYSPESVSDLGEVLIDLLNLPVLGDVVGYDGGIRAQVALKRATSELTGRFTSAAVTATVAVAGVGPLARYAADLVVPARIAAECALLKGLAARYVMLREGVAAMQQRQRQLLTELVDALTRRAPHHLDTALRPAWQEAPDDAARLRVVVDQVARLTDMSAVEWHARLTGAPGSPEPGIL